MRLVLFSPLVPESAIGIVTSLVCSALADLGHEVTIIRSEDDPFLARAPRQMPNRIIPWTDDFVVRDSLQIADAIIYQVGDNYPFHRGCLEWMPKAPGVICLHDFFVGNLFRAWADHHLSEAEACLRAWYGPAVAQRYFDFGNPASFVERTVDEAPMTEWVASMATGVMTHASWGVDRVLRGCGGPVQVTPLPYEGVELPMRPGERQQREATTFKVLTVGHINANKRVRQVVHAIAQSERLRNSTVYRLVGQIDPDDRQRLVAEAERLGVRLLIEGRVSDAQLSEAFAEADVLSCLRRPALEAASASTIEALLHGKAVMVMDTGFYAELPDQVVAKITQDRELEDIRLVLERLHDDPDQREALGLRGAEWARATFRADNYADGLIQLCGRAAAAAPVIEMTRFYSRALAAWGLAEPALALVTDLVDPLQIFDSD